MQKKKLGLKIGITGGIGAGKTTISRIFKVMRIPVYNADERAKDLMNQDHQLKMKIVQLFGSDAYRNGELNRKYLADLVFENANVLKTLNQLVHPIVRKDYHTWLTEHGTKEYTIKEAALLFETGSYKELDQIIFVYAPLPIRIDRILLRDEHRTRLDIEKIIHNQMNDHDKKKLADYTIYNDETKLVIPQVVKIHHQLLNRAADKK